MLLKSGRSKPWKCTNSSGKWSIKSLSLITCISETFVILTPASSTNLFCDGDVKSPCVVISQWSRFEEILGDSQVEHGVILVWKSEWVWYKGGICAISSRIDCTLQRNIYIGFQKKRPLFLFCFLTVRVCHKTVCLLRFSSSSLNFSFPLGNIYIPLDLRSKTKQKWRSFFGSQYI